MSDIGSAARGAGYDVMVDWDKRLSRELPFLEAVFAETHEIHRVLDVGCGTGHHAIALAQRGLEVVGVDPLREMLDQARINARRAGVGIEFVEGGFGELASLGLGQFDALICTGNALPHVEGIDRLDPVLEDFGAVLRRGGALVVHLLNHERLLKSRQRSLPPVIRDHEAGTTVFLRLLEYEPLSRPERIWIEFLTANKDRRLASEGDPDLGWRATADRSAHTVMTFPVLRGALERTCFWGVRAFGDHSGKDFEPSTDESVIVTARRERRATRR